MTPKHVRLIPRIGLFAALIYILSWATSLLPNVSLVFFIVFSAGFMWGVLPGVLTGMVGMGLTTLFNPYGPAALPIMIAQIGGAAISGLFGAVYFNLPHLRQSKLLLYVSLGAASLACTISFFLPVNIVDAWLFQPFWERFVISSGWSLISVVSNVIIFTILFPALLSFYHKERKLLC